MYWQSRVGTVGRKEGFEQASERVGQECQAEQQKSRQKSETIDRKALVGSERLLGVRKVL